MLISAAHFLGRAQFNWYIPERVIYARLLKVSTGSAGAYVLLFFSSIDDNWEECCSGSNWSHSMMKIKRIWGSWEWVDRLVAQLRGKRGSNYCDDFEPQSQLATLEAGYSLGCFVILNAQTHFYLFKQLVFFNWWVPNVRLLLHFLFVKRFLVLHVYVENSCY